MQRGQAVLSGECLSGPFPGGSVSHVLAGGWLHETAVLAGDGRSQESVCSVGRLDGLNRDFFFLVILQGGHSVVMALCLRLLSEEQGACPSPRARGRGECFSVEGFTP